MSIHLDAIQASQKVLFLQGPMGGFFNRVADWLMAQQKQTFKVNLNGGDWVFTHTSSYTAVLNYTGSFAYFEHWLMEFIEKEQIDAIVCFGDCRKYHVVARLVTKILDINFFAFEEGYIRPNFITFEKDGVNSYSKFICNFSTTTFNKLNQNTAEIAEVNNQYYKMVVNAIIYYSFSFFLDLWFKNYQHHRGMSALAELKSWFISGYRRIKNAFIDPIQFNEIQNKHAKQYFVFPLQVHNDSQLLVHSELKCMKKYIDQVLASFSENALERHHLVIKHHPMDRGYRHYGALIKQLATKYAISKRVHYVCDINLPILLKNSLGLVTVNSTTGLQGLYHAIPVKVLGHALYDLPELTVQNDLDFFWTGKYYKNDNYKIFRTQLIQYSQLNGSYYGKTFWMR